MKERLLDCPIQLQRATFTTNALKEKIATWNNLGPRVLAERSLKSAGENLRAQQIQATLMNRYVIRWAETIADLNPKDRLMDGARVYEILDVHPLDRNEWLEIHAVARAD